MIERATGYDVERCRPPLIWITVALLLLTVVHDLDHVRQGRALDVELYGVAVVALTMLTMTLTLLLRRHPIARITTVAVGIATVLGVGVVHVAPRHALLSDSYSSAHADALSWAIVILMMLAGAVLAVVGACSLGSGSQEGTPPGTRRGDQRRSAARS